MAAGVGKRMKSQLTKMLHTLAGRPLVYFPVRAVLDSGASRAVVVTSPSARDHIDSFLSQAFGRSRIECVVQDPPRGTADAARVGFEALTSPGERVLIVNGDVPLLRPEDLTRLGDALDAHRTAVLSLMTCLLDDPAGYGRVLRDGEGRVLEVREHRDLTGAGQSAVREVNAGAYLAKSSLLRKAFDQIKPTNDQGEYYLTDVVAIAAREGGATAVRVDPEAMLGVNDRAQLAECETILFQRIAERHARAGVTVRGDARIEDAVEIEPDATIEPGVSLRGKTVIAGGATVDVGCVVTDSTIGQNALLKPYSVVTASTVGPWAQIGPFAHLRPDSRIEEKAHIGNFVETKKTRVGRGAKANHLAYLGDGDVGEESNIGAGTIFCNYDGFQKHRTVIEEGVFVGSDSQLVAPVRIGRGAYVGTGTTVTKDVPEDALAVGRARQENKEGYAARLRARLAAKAGRRSKPPPKSDPVAAKKGI